MFTKVIPIYKKKTFGGINKLRGDVTDDDFFEVWLNEGIFSCIEIFWKCSSISFLFAFVKFHLVN